MADMAFPTDADFEVFYERHWKYVYRLCFSYMKNQSDAEDCAEDAFVRALSRDLPFEDEVHERKWLTVTAINLCKDKLKSAAYKTTISMEDDSVKEPAAEEAEDFSDVLDAVLALPAKYKDVVWLFYYDGYQTDEIASMLERPASTIRNQLRDARAILKKTIERSRGS